MKTDSIAQSVCRNLIILLGILVVLSGCKSTKKESTDAAGPAEETTKKEDLIQELTSYPLPTAYEITDMLHEAGASYILTLSNPASKVGNYISSAEKALNLGVYGTDLSYASTYMMKQETMRYLESSKKLIDELEISTAFNVSYAERVESNLDTRDSLITIISDSFIDTWDYLVQNEEDKLAILVVSGSYIEGLYITTQIAITAADNTPFLEVIAHQKKSLGTLIGIIEPIKEDADMADIYKSLIDLAEIYEEVGETLTTGQLEKVLSVIDPLRESIV
ncbi:MAG: hypothetical protein AMS23_04070 [Bacteroides sp. SM1_62]|nr:MAG: hypothetical protein AMS23_04070 [Bacteroides sp. SM1_62]